MSDVGPISRWFAVDRMDLPAVLFGVSDALARHSGIRSPLHSKSPIHVGFVSETTTRRYEPPDLVVIDDELAIDTFAWLQVYAPNLVPVSQFARVISRSDWALVESEMASISRTVRSDRWASLLLGEALAQGPLEVDLSEVPLARATSCFTLPVARSSIRFSAGQWQWECLERLGAMERDVRFRPRNVGTEALSPMWAVLAEGDRGDLDPVDACALLLDSQMSALDANPQLWDGANPWEQMDTSGLLRESIEDRVRAFYEIVERLSSDRDRRSPRNNVQLAVAAFLVGRGTSHAFLLRRAGGAFRTAQVWFGLLAALAGPRTWEVEWSRSAKSLERLVRGSIPWDSPGTTDISWLEYEWLTTTREGLDAFVNLPRSQPSALNVEVLPGVACQMRLDLPDPVVEPVIEPLREPERERLLTEQLRRFVELASSTRELLGEKASESPERVRRPKPASTRSRKAKRPDDE